MQQLFDLFYLFVLLNGLIVSIRISIESKKAQYIAFSIAFIAFLLVVLFKYNEVVGLNKLINGNEYLLVDWANIVAISFVLSGLAFLIYDSKPVYARFPIWLCFIPLILIPAYFFGQETFVIKEWIMAIYEGGSLIVALMMYITLSIKKLDYLIVSLGIAIITISYILYWFQPGLNENFVWVWKTLSILGIIIVIHGFKKIELNDKFSSTT